MTTFDLPDLTHPGVVLARLEELERELALMQNDYEHAASRWFQAQREIKKAFATALLTSTEASVTAKKAEGDLAAYSVEGAEYEPEFETLKAKRDMLDKRAMILMAVLKAQGRA